MSLQFEQHGDGNVHGSYVRPKLCCESPGSLLVIGFPDDLEILLLLQEH